MGLVNLTWVQYAHVGKYSWQKDTHCWSVVMDLPAMSLKKRPIRAVVVVLICPATPVVELQEK